MSDAPTWMVDGKPGLVLEALKAAQQQADKVGKQADKKKTMTFQGADETIAVGTKAVLAAGATYQLVLGDPDIEEWTSFGDKGQVTKAHVKVRATLTIIHPGDGSYVESMACSTSLVNGFGKYTGAANTGARKQVWLTALGITTGESDGKHEEPEEPEVIPEAVEFLVAELEAVQTRDELREVCCTEEYKAIRGKWRSYLAQCGRYQEKRLIRLGERKGLGPSVHPDEFKTG